MAVSTWYFLALDEPTPASVFISPVIARSHLGARHAGRVAGAAFPFGRLEMNRRLLSVVGGALLLAGFAAVSTRQTAEAVQAGATISGKIKFTGTKPTNPRIDMSEEAACKAKYPAPPRPRPWSSRERHARNVFVYVKSGLPAGQTYPAPATPVILDQGGCRYHPHVLGVMVGQNLEIQNSDPSSTTSKPRP